MAETFKIKTVDFLNLIGRLLYLTRSNYSENIILNLNQSELNIYYKNNIEKTNLRTVFFEKLEIVSNLNKIICLPIAELVNIKLPKVSQKDTSFIDIKIYDSKLNISYLHQWKSNTKPTVYSLDLTLAAEPKNNNDYNIFNDCNFSSCLQLSSSELGNILKLINIYTSDATTKQANNILLQLRGESLLILSTDSTTAAKINTAVIRHNYNKDFSVAVTSSCLKVLELFISKSDAPVHLYTKNKKVYANIKNKFLVFPICAGEEELEPYADLFNDLPVVIGEIELDILTESIKSLINNTKNKFFKLRLDGNSKKKTLNLKGEDGSISNLPIDLNQDIKGAVDAYLLINVLSKVDKKDTIDIGFDSDRNLWCLKLKEIDLTFLIQGMS